MQVLYQVLIRGKVSQTLPNITGSLTGSTQFKGSGTIQYDGVFASSTVVSQSYCGYSSDASGHGYSKINFNASKSSSVYKANANVIPNSIKCSFYIRY